MQEPTVLLSSIILFVSILLQFSAAGIALNLIKYTGSKRAWIAIAAAILLMAVPRLITFAHFLSGAVSHPPDPVAEIVPLVISALLVIGLAWIAPIFCAIRHSEEAFQESERKLSTLMSSLPGMAYRCANQPDWPFQFASDGALELTGYTATDFINQNITFGALILPEDNDLVWDEVQEAINQNRPFILEYRIQTADGQTKWVWEKGVAIFSESNRLQALEGFITDITERKQTEEALQAQIKTAKLLLRELDHRVRNNLSALLSLIDLSCTGAASTTDLAAAFRSRTQALASVHTLLSDAQWQSGDLEGMLRNLIQPARRTRLEIDGPHVLIPLSQAQALGLVINELTTNSTKYGAMSVEEAVIRIRWTTHSNANGETNLILTWREIGGPHINEKPEAGNGMNLIKGLIRSELRGRAELSFPTTGAAHTLHLTLANDATAQFSQPPAPVVSGSRRVTANAQ